MSKNNNKKQKQQASAPAQQPAPVAQQSQPAAPQAAPAPFEFTAENAVGVTISVRTVLDEMVVGEIYAYDPSMHLLALCTQQIYAQIDSNKIFYFTDISGGQHESSKIKSFKILNTNAIRDVFSMEFPDINDPSQSLPFKTNVPFADLTTPLPTVKIDTLRKVCSIMHWFSHFLRQLLTYTRFFSPQKRRENKQLLQIDNTN